ncbi:MAG: SDR family NAD(P)-dependent oxidoreductase [Fuerstiella sp.]
MKTFDNKTAFLTGAASGIGRELALQLSSLGCNLYLVDIDEVGLHDVARTIGQKVRVQTRVCDLADPTAISSTLSDFDRNAEVIDLLISNAGVLYYGPTHEMSQDQWDWLMKINLLAPIQITNHFLPQLMERPDAHIANMCSISGMVAGGRFAAYHTSKFGLIGFTEALRAEYGRKGIGVTAVCPGPVQTSLSEAGVAKENGSVPTPPAFLCASAARVAALTIKAIRRNKRQIVITPMAHGLFQLKRFAPGLIDFTNQFSRKKKRRLAELQQKELERLASKADPEDVNLRRVA